MTSDLLDRLETYYDTVPRSSARAEEHGPLTLFVREGTAGWPFYARPSRSASRPVDVADVEAVRARQRELGVSEAFEWVHEITPTLRAAVEASGLTVHEHPLMVRDPDRPAPEPAGHDVRILAADDPALLSAVSVGHVAFAAPGTHVGDAGVAELRAAMADPESAARAERVAARIRAGLTVVAAVLDADGLALCSGQHQPVGGVTEIVGVGTLPSARRAGLGQAVTTALVRDALAGGVSTVFLSADDDAVARIYQRIGFRRVGTVLIAEPAA